MAELDTALLVVLGHYDCGAAKAACSGEKHPTPNLEALAKKIAPACQQGGGKQALNLSIEENIRRSAEDVLARSNLQGTEVEAGRLAVVKAVYDVASGRVQEVH